LCGVKGQICYNLFVLKKIIITNPQDQKIVGVLHTGKLSTLFITIHGFKSSKENFAIKELSNQLNQEGYPVYRLDLVNANKKDSALDIIQQVKKISLTALFFKKNYKKIILVGGSLGALVSMYAAKDSSNINGLVTINGFFYFWGVKWRDFKTILLLFISSLFNNLSRNILIYYYKNLQPKKIKYQLSLYVASTINVLIIANH